MKDKYQGYISYIENQKHIENNFGSNFKREVKDWLATELFNHGFLYEDGEVRKGWTHWEKRTVDIMVNFEK